MDRFFKFKSRRGGNADVELQPGGSSVSVGRSRSPELHPALASLPQFTPSPIDLAHFAEGEVHHQQLVNLFLHTAYPRAPTSVPPNGPWEATVHTAHDIIGYQPSSTPGGYKQDPLPSDTRIIFAYGPGVWQPRNVAQTFGENSHGDRLALLLPDAAKSGVHIPGNSELPSTTWEYRQMLKEITPSLSPPLPWFAPYPYASFWICRPLDKAGHRLQDSQGRLRSRDVGIVVVFVREADADRAHDRKFDEHGANKTRERMAYIPSGAPPAFVELARALMKWADADGVPPAAGWTLRLDKARTVLHVKGPAAHVWVYCVAQKQSTVMYTLPEGRPGLRSRLTLCWEEDEVQQDGSTQKVHHDETVTVVHAGQRVDKITNLVTRTRWSVLRGLHNWPQQLGNLQEVIFEA